MSSGYKTDCLDLPPIKTDMNLLAHMIMYKNINLEVKQKAMQLVKLESSKLKELQNRILFITGLESRHHKSRIAIRFQKFIIKIVNL